MSIFEPEPKVDVLLKRYPTYRLYARVKEKDVENFKKTRDASYILYKHCINGITNIPNYKLLITAAKEKAKQENLEARIARGYKST